jgi:hypothetical protein
MPHVSQPKAERQRCDSRDPRSGFRIAPQIQGRACVREAFDVTLKGVEPAPATNYIRPHVPNA